MLLSSRHVQARTGAGCATTTPCATISRGHLHRLHNAWLSPEARHACSSGRSAGAAAPGVNSSSGWSNGNGQGARSSRCRVAQDDQALYTDFSMTPESERACDFAVAMAKVASDTKVQDLVVLHVEPLISWTSYMLICTVFSKPQLMAVLSRIEKAATEEWDRQKQNSVGSSPWEVMDYGDVVVHVFTPDQRDYYDIESFYAAAEEVDLPFDVEASSSAAAGSSSGGTVGASSRSGPSWSKQQIA